MSVSAAQADLLYWLEKNPETPIADWCLDGHCGASISALAWRNADRVIGACERRGWIAYTNDEWRLTELGRQILATLRKDESE